jgi:prepilin-type N-terminal cleavage/methylation domain-containing protein
MTSGPLARRGFTLVELLISMIVTAIIGAALVRMVLSQARFMDQQEAWREARSVSRGGINRLLSDLRAVEASGGVRVAAAGGQDFTVRVPYAFGILCGVVGSVYTVSLLPVDATMYAEPGYTGFAIRNASGLSYTYNAKSLEPVAGNNALCITGLYDQINTVPAFNGSPAGTVVNLTRAGIMLPAPARGSIVYMYRDIRYEFKASVNIPGRTALWRTPVSAVASAEELAAPFNATARVNFYNLDVVPAQAAVPVPLGNVRGLELLLNGMSERTPAGSAAPKTANMTTSVFFENRPD